MFVLYEMKSISIPDDVYDLGHNYLWSMNVLEFYCNCHNFNAGSCKNYQYINKIRSKYHDFIYQTLNNESRQYIIDKWKSIQRIFGAETTYKEYQVINDNWKKQRKKDMHKKYCTENKEELKKKREKYHQQIKIRCECGGRYLNIESSRSRHFETDLHKKYLYPLDISVVEQNP